MHDICIPIIVYILACLFKMFFYGFIFIYLCIYAGRVIFKLKKVISSQTLIPFSTISAMKGRSDSQDAKLFSKLLTPKSGFITKLLYNSNSKLANSFSPSSLQQAPKHTKQKYLSRLFNNFFFNTICSSPEAASIFF